MLLEELLNDKDVRKTIINVAEGYTTYITQEQYDGIDWKDFKSEVEKSLKMKVIINPKFRQFDGLIQVTSNNLVSGAGILTNFLDEVRIVSSGGFEEKKNSYWISVGLKWRQKGTKGLHSNDNFLDGYYSFDKKKWTFDS